MTTTTCDVAIVGAGIGGCALARFLKLHSSLSVRVFEKDASFAVRSQGYAFTMQQAHSALSKLDLYETVEAEDLINEAHFVFRADGKLLGGFGPALNHVSGHAAFMAERGRRGPAAERGAAVVERVGEVVHAVGAEEDTAAGSAEVASAPSSACAKGSEREDVATREDVAVGTASSTNSSEEGRAAPKQCKWGKKARNLHLPRQRLRELLLLGSGKNSGNSSSSNSDALDIDWGWRFEGFVSDVGVDHQQDVADNQDVEDHDAQWSEAHQRFLLSRGEEEKMCVRARVVVGADGLRSAVRRALVSTAASPEGSPADRWRAESAADPLDYLNVLVLLGICPNAALQDAAHFLLDQTTFQTCGDETTFQTGAPRGDGVVEAPAEDPVRLFVMPFSKSHTFWQLSFRFSADELARAESVEKGSSTPGGGSSVGGSASSGRGSPRSPRAGGLFDPASDARRKLALEKTKNWHAPVGGEGGLIASTPLDSVGCTPVWERRREYVTSTGPLGAGGPLGSPLGQNDVIGEDAVQGADAGLFPTLPRVVLIGDAAHPMTPFKGQGANQALLDAVELGERLVAFVQGKKWRKDGQGRGKERRRTWSRSPPFPPPETRLLSPPSKTRPPSPPSKTSPPSPPSSAISSIPCSIAPGRRWPPRAACSTTCTSPRIPSCLVWSAG